MEIQFLINFMSSLLSILTQSVETNSLLIFAFDVNVFKGDVLD